MPYKSIEVKAELFCQWKARKIYYVYKDNDMNMGHIRDYQFVSDPYDGEDQSFDIRELPNWTEPAVRHGREFDKHRRKILKEAIEQDLIAFSEDE